MSNSHDIIRDKAKMLAGMSPVLCRETYVFCSTKGMETDIQIVERCLALFREDEGLSFVLAKDDAERFGFDSSMPMARIVLSVFSALDGVGLTAAVSSVLAEDGIPCNIISAYHHDNVFVPEYISHRALGLLKGLQMRATKLDCPVGV